MGGKPDKVQRWLSQGGERALRSGAKGEVFTRHGDKLERESPGGEYTQVSNLLDPHLLLSERQRATGNCYGHHAEQATTSGPTEFLREFVDRSVSGSGGSTERHIQMIRMVDTARKEMGRQPMICYPLGRSRGEGSVGPHKPVRPGLLLDAICLHGYKLETVAVVHGWTVERLKGAKVGLVVPDRQRKRLAEALRVILDAVYDAWDARGYSVPYEFTQLVVRK